MTRAEFPPPLRPTPLRPSARRRLMSWLAALPPPRVHRPPNAANPRSYVNVTSESTSSDVSGLQGPISEAWKCVWPSYRCGHSPPPDTPTDTRPRTRHTPPTSAPRGPPRPKPHPRGVLSADIRRRRLPYVKTDYFLNAAQFDAFQIMYDTDNLKCAFLRCRGTSSLPCLLFHSLFFPSTFSILRCRVTGR